MAFLFGSNVEGSASDSFILPRSFEKENFYGLGKREFLMKYETRSKDERLSSKFNYLKPVRIKCHGENQLLYFK